MFCDKCGLNFHTEKCPNCKNINTQKDSKKESKK